MTVARANKQQHSSPHHCVHVWHRYGQCGGKANPNTPYRGMTSCCDDATCVKKDNFYSQCLPPDDPRSHAKGMDGSSYDDDAYGYDDDDDDSSTATTASSERPAVVASAPPDRTAELQRYSTALTTAASHLSTAPWSTNLCVGLLRVTHAEATAVRVIRNPGGGTSRCCSMHPIAAGARVHDSTVQVRLEPRTSHAASAWESRNGARVYLATAPPAEQTALTSGGGAVCGASRIPDVKYTAWPLLGRTLAFTVDLSSAGCGCNAAGASELKASNPGWVVFACACAL